MKIINFKFLLLAFYINCLGFDNVESQVNQQWVARYNGPIDSIDKANSLVVDGSGNVYVTGNSYSAGGNFGDYATIKYNSAGVQQWVARYNGPGNGNDVAYSIALDNFGNVYVTGSSFRGGSSFNTDYATIKYNSSGVQQWVQIYNGPNNNTDGATSIEVDNSGNVYVTGYASFGGGSSSDYATIKYNSAGDSVWVKRYSGPANLSDNPTSITIDALGNVYVTGGSEGIGTSSDYATIKYNSAGIQLWVARYNGPKIYDFANSIAVDGAGNVYVIGYTGNSQASTFADYATIKYNSAGDSVWVKRYNGPANSADYATSLALDNSGNVYVTGYSIGSGPDYATIKYNSAGVQQWVARYNGPGLGSFNIDEAVSIAVDGFSNVYVTGWSFDSVAYQTDYATIKYNSTGVQQWVARYNGPGNDDDRATSIAVDNSGNVYVTGSSFGIGTGEDYATVKYSSSIGITQISSELPEQFNISQNYPNPFNPTTNIEFDLPKKTFVKVIIYNSIGQDVTTLVNEELGAGSYQIVWDASDYPSGVYFYKIVTEGFEQAKRMILLK